MTPPAAARLKGYFALAAPVCVVVRRGPTRHTQMILWRTDTDEFTPGQWITGRVSRMTLSSDGRYAAIGLMSGLRYGLPYDRQHSVVCRPPYFSALEVWFDGLRSSDVRFLPDDRLTVVARRQRVHAPNPCPFERVTITHSKGPWEHPHVIDATRGPAEGRDQSGRRIRFADGRIYALDGVTPRLLFDANEYSFEKIAPPEWATRW